MENYELLVHFKEVDNPIILVKAILDVWYNEKRPMLLAQSKSELGTVTDELLRSKLTHGTSQGVALKLKSSKSKRDGIVFETYFTNPNWNISKLNYLSISIPERFIFQSIDGFSEKSIGRIFSDIAKLCDLKKGYFENSSIVHDEDLWKKKVELAKIRGEGNWPVVPAWFFFVPRSMESKIKTEVLQVVETVQNGIVVKMKTHYNAVGFEDHKQEIIKLIKVLT
ncbi:MAG: hypothetical protein JXD23_07445 [Spirochaetales bacterium]|nr:hypothetical protein [Spirochaetales bacterium]